jgi:type II secretory pathway component PulJ
MDSRQKERAAALRQAHVALERDLENLEARLREPAELTPAELHLRLSRTRTDLAEHFRREEENGYMNTVLEHSPNRDQVVQHLLQEHRFLLDAVNALIEAAAGHQPDAELRRKVLTWIESLRDHEMRENILVQDAFNLDVAAED